MDSIEKKLEILSAELKNELSSINDIKLLENFKIKALGKKSEIYNLSRTLSSLEIEKRKQVGAKVNLLKNELLENIEKIESSIKSKLEEDKIKNEKIDISMPGKYYRLGSTHPINLVLDEIINIFRPMGFTIESGPEIEHDFYNFEALNHPKDHPARDLQDTFYISPDVVLRTHTSPVQIRTMMRTKPPIRVLSPGRVYRSDYDVSHTPMFHQVEGLFVDQDVNFTHLKGTILYFVKKMFGEKTKMRFRPSYFPFVEPGAEVDISCIICGGKGCRVCKNTGWLEILGCGMVHPNVFEKSGYDPNIRGFAFGMGIERIAMLKYKINDLRLFFESDVRFLRQFI